MALLTALALLVPHNAALAQANEPTFVYVTQEGDSCPKVAARFFGDRDAYHHIHRYNKGLGPTPHNFPVGTVLILPVLKRDPDAWVTGLWGAVKAKAPSNKIWKEARRGMDLFRAWRVNSQEQASAEITFKDNSQIRMRENTIVIIYGGNRTKSRRIVQQTELETGALRANLGALAGDGNPDTGNLVISTPSSETEMEGGNVLVKVDKAKTTRVANHGKRPVKVGGRAKKSKRVAVDPNMGSKVAPGKDPTPPKPLPDTPTWATKTRLFTTVGGEGSFAASWNKVDKAERYRLEIWQEDKDGKRIYPVAPMTLSKDEFGFELQNMAPGVYFASLASIDNDQFESRPSDKERFELVAIAVRPHNDADTQLASNDTFWVGSRLIAPDGFECSVDGADATGEQVLEDAGEHKVRCTNTDGVSTEELALEVKRPDMTIERADGMPMAPIDRKEPTDIVINGPADFPGPITIEGPDGISVSEPKLIKAGQWQATITPSSGAPTSFSLAMMVQGPDETIEISAQDFQLMEVESGFGMHLHLGYGRLFTAADIDRDGLQNTGRLGAALRYNFSPSIAIEADLTLSLGSLAIPPPPEDPNDNGILADDIQEGDFTEPKSELEPLVAVGYRAQLVWTLSESDIAPFLVFGGGAETFLVGGTATAPLAHFGGGLILTSAEGYGIRLGLLQSLGFADGTLLPWTEAQLGVHFDF